MYEISFYEDEKGNSDIKELIEKLRDKSKKDKDARINYHKIVAYIDLLEEYGTHNELVHKEGGIYSKMFAAQAKYYA